MVAAAPYKQDQTADYVNDFPAIMAKSYTVVDKEAPLELLAACSSTEQQQFPSTGTVLVVPTTTGGTVVSSLDVQAQCAEDSTKTCIIDGDLTLQMESSLKVHSLILRNGAKLLWTDENAHDHMWLCAGYVAVEIGGKFTLQLDSLHAWIYIMNNGAVHPSLRSRAFGAVGTKNNDSDIQPVIDIRGRNLPRTWSLLETPLVEGSTTLKLLHHPLDMGWQIDDRIAIAPMENQAKGNAQEFVIDAIEADGTIRLDRASSSHHGAKAFVNPAPGGEAIFQSAEVINLSRNVVISGDDFEEVQCDPNLPEAVPGEQTSTQGCRCSSFRDSCTVGLHTIHMNGGTSRIENTRVEKCGQRGIEGKYCLHFHQLEACPDCLFRNNAVETSQQRGLIVHGTHLSTSESNVFYNVRGASLYIEDGNEMANTLAYNVAICPWKFSDGGCTVPGTSNSQSDTKDNQSGLYSKAPTNNLIGNRMVNHFNGMFLEANGVGRGSSYGQVCTRNTPIGRIEGNVFHSNGRFGTYLLSYNYPQRDTGQTITQNGYTTSCDPWNFSGEDNGYSTALRNNFDYGNAFVGHYEAGDIQYSHHTSIDNLNLIYWKETKVFADGCSAHIRDSLFQGGTMALPDALGSFIIENTVLQDTLLEANHHCTIGTTGFLCMPHYILHKVTWVGHPGKWVSFNRENNQNNGGIFSLSPEDAAANTADSEGLYFLPAGYVSLVSSRFQYLLDTTFCESSTTLGFGERYEYGILCKKALRVLKIFTKDLEKSGAPNLMVDIFDTNPTRALVSTVSVPLHTTDARKQGYVLPVFPGPDFEYRLKLSTATGDIPEDWVIDFGDMAINNRWGAEELHLDVQGRNCGDVVYSYHDRRYAPASTVNWFDELSWGRGACTIHPKMQEATCFDIDDIDKLQPMECSEFCGNGGDGCGAGGYCDCHREQCVCKPGRSGDNCEIDVCESSTCVNGACSSRFLGSDIPVSDVQCVCDEGWAGTACDINPCQDIDCGDHGKCKALSETETMCECNLAWHGAQCTETCEDRCFGSYPYGCATELDSAVRYLCGPSQNQCHYAFDLTDSVPEGWCTFKSVGVAPNPNPLPTEAPPPSPGTSAPTPVQTITQTSVPTSADPPMDPGPACESHCVGEWPFGCAQDVSNIVNYMCHSDGGCYYAEEHGDAGPYAGFCVFKGIDVDIGNPPDPIALTPEAPMDPGPACESHCVGEWPFGCAQDLSNIVNYMCHSDGGCYYAEEHGDSGPYGGFCVFKGAGAT